MIIYKHWSGADVKLWEFNAIRGELESADGTPDLLMRLRRKWPFVATDKRIAHLLILLDGDAAGRRIVYVDTRVGLSERGLRP